MLKRLINQIRQKTSVFLTSFTKAVKDLFSKVVDLSKDVFKFVKDKLNFLNRETGVKIASTSEPEIENSPALEAKTNQDRSVRRLKVEYYRSGKKQEWRWRIIASNGRKLAMSSESYKNKLDCVHALNVIANNLTQADIIFVPDNPAPTVE